MTLQDNFSFYFLTLAFATAGPIPIVSDLIQPEWYQSCDK